VVARDYEGLVAKDEASLYEAGPTRRWLKVKRKGWTDARIVGSGASAFARAMTLLADLEQFASEHHAHGPLTADATEPAWNGYLLTVVCSCGVVFRRWVTPEAADAELLRFARLN
jgi:ATP-dependent DNA ligase